MTGDAGTVANWYARDIRMRRGMMGSLSGSARVARLGDAVRDRREDGLPRPPGDRVHRRRRDADERPERDDHVSKYWRAWSDPRLIVMVLNNRDLSQVTWEERVQIGDGKTESTQSIPDFPYHRYAELLGFRGILVDDPEAIGAGLGRGARARTGRRSSTA